MSTNRVHDPEAARHPAAPLAAREAGAARATGFTFFGFYWALGAPGGRSRT